MEEQLALSPATTFPLRAGIPTKEGMPQYADIKPMAVDLEAAAETIPDVSAYMKELFVR